MRRVTRIADTLGHYLCGHIFACEVCGTWCIGPRDARYCSATCRSRASRQRKREGKTMGKYYAAYWDESQEYPPDTIVMHKGRPWIAKQHAFSSDEPGVSPKWSTDIDNAGESFTCTAEERRMLDLMHNANLQDVNADDAAASFVFNEFPTGNDGHDLAKAVYAAMDNPPQESIVG